MSRRTKVAAVKYLNTLPMLAGLRESAVCESLEVVLEAPAICAELLFAKEVEVALCPIGALTELDKFFVASKFGIGCRGAVRTVALYSNRPLSELKAVRLYNESRTSNLLVQVLDKYFWKYNLQFVSEGEEVSVPAAELVIGDACFEMESKYPYVTDLGEAWYQFTGLPFLFAAWVSLTPVDTKLWSQVDEAFRSGIEDVDNMEIPGAQSHIHVRSYLQDNIRYEVDVDALAGMQKFMDLVKGLDEKTDDAIQTPSGQSI